MGFEVVHAKASVNEALSIEENKFGHRIPCTVDAPHGRQSQTRQARLSNVDFETRRGRPRPPATTTTVLGYRGESRNDHSGHQEANQQSLTQWLQVPFH